MFLKIVLVLFYKQIQSAALLYDRPTKGNPYEVKGDKVPYKWIEFDDRWDFIVGIAVDAKPVSVGSFIDEDVVITSANPLEKYRYPKQNEKIDIYYINETWNKTRQVQVDCITTTFFKSRKRFWMPHGRNGTHSPIHDLLLVKLKFSVAGSSFVPTRKPFIAMMVQPSTYISTRRYAYAGFGYIDKEHIEDNVQLEMDFYEKHVRVDCDEYIPSEWGRFICINDTFKYSGLASGAPLVYNYQLIGIGSFSLTKNGEHILVFTDLKPYRYRMGICQFNKNYTQYERYHWITYDKTIYIGEDPNKGNK